MRTKSKELSFSSTPVAPGCWRKVLNTVEHLNPGWWKSSFVGGSKRLKLECGHEGWCKNSRPTPKKTKCRQCQGLTSGAVQTSFDTKNKIAHEEWMEGLNLMRKSRKMTPEEIVKWTRF